LTAWAIIPVALPVVVALVTVMLPHRVIRIIAAVVLGGFALISAFSIGLFYVSGGGDGDCGEGGRTLHQAWRHRFAAP
jgi:hypothetical protein